MRENERQRERERERERERDYVASQSIVNGHLHMDW